MNIKEYIKLIKNNTSKKDIILIILAIISLFIWISGTVFAFDEISWSSTNQQITDEQFKNIIFSNMNLSVDVLNENFDSYTSTISNFNYTRDILNTYLNNSSYTKAFMNYDNKLVLILGSNKIQLYYQNFANSSLPKKYYLNNTSFVFDFNNKTIESFNTQQQYPFYDLGWWLDGTDVTQTEFETTAYKQNMIYDTFFLILGPIYDNANTTEILNYVKSYKIDGNLYENEQFTGEIVFSNDYESWQTRNLSSNFINSEYTFAYYVHGLDYSENGIASDSSFKVKISDINFTSDSIYLPSINQVNNAIKQAEGYMNYAYVITLTIDDVLLLRSDVFIVDAKPITVIPYFRYKYDYIYYGSYINIGDTSGDGSGDNTGNNTITSGDIQQATQGGIVAGNNEYWGTDLNSGDFSGDVGGMVDNAFNDVSGELSNSEIFQALEMSEQGFINALKEEPRRF